MQLVGQIANLQVNGHERTIAARLAACNLHEGRRPAIL